MITKNIGISNSLAKNIIADSPLVIENKQFIVSFLIQYSEILYGVKSSNMPVIFWDVAFNAICERFKSITIQDIQNSFIYATIEKKQYVTLTRDEIIEPIIQYWNKKEHFLLEMEKAQKRENEEIERQKKEYEFLKQAEQCYLESLKIGQWQGDMFQARVLVKPFWDNLFKEDREFITQLANDKIIADKNKAISDPFVIVYDKLYYLAQETMIYAIKKGKKLIKQ